jgi:hypothetical protein
VIYIKTVIQQNLFLKRNNIFCWIRGGKIKMGTTDDIKKKAKREGVVQAINGNLGYIGFLAGQEKDPVKLDGLLLKVREISGLGSPVPVSTN